MSALADHAGVSAALSADGGHAEAVLEALRHEGVDDLALSERLQREGADFFAASWKSLLARIQEKSASLAGTAHEL